MVLTRLEESTTTQKTILFLVLSGAWVGGLWYLCGQRPEPECIVAARLRGAKSLSVEARAQRGESGLESFNANLSGLADTFRIRGKKVGKVDALLYVPLFNLDDANQLILIMYPPDVANVDGNLYEIDPGFWAALLERAPKMLEWVQKKAPSNIPAGLPKAVPAKKAPAAASAN